MLPGERASTATRSFHKLLEKAGRAQLRYHDHARADFRQETAAIRHPLMLRRMADRRRYPRVRADVICRPAGSGLTHQRRNTTDISLGGMRVYSDEDFRVGSRLELDVLLPNEASVRCWAEVVWLAKLGEDSVARYDLGLRFIDMAPDDVQRLAGVLVRS